MSYGVLYLLITIDVCSEKQCLKHPVAKLVMLVTRNLPREQRNWY